MTAFPVVFIADFLEGFSDAKLTKAVAFVDLITETKPSENFTQDIAKNGVDAAELAMARLCYALAPFPAADVHYILHLCEKSWQEAGTKPAKGQQMPAQIKKKIA